MLQQTRFKRISDEKYIKLLMWICSILYFSSYMTRLNYSAVVSEISHSTGIANDLLAFPTTGLFITYGVGQIISGLLGDRFSPKNLMLLGLLTSSFMNALLPLSTNPLYMTVLWCINGFGQALLWPPMVKILSGYLSNTDYVRACFVVIIGSTSGTIGIYLLAAAFTHFFNWQTLFYVCAAFGFIGVIMGYTGITKIEKFAMLHGEVSNTPHLNGEKEEEAVPTVKMTKGIIILIITLMSAIILQGSLRDGVTTWMPSYIRETFNLGSASSILSGVIMPTLTLICLGIVKMIFPRFIKNEVAFAGIIFSISMATALILAIYPTSMPILSIGCSAIIVACMHGVNQMLICFVPRQFKKCGNISTISGLLNFATYVGSALSTYVFALLAKGNNWRPVIVLWVFISLFGALICFGLTKPWKKFIRQ